MLLIVYAPVLALAYAQYWAVLLLSPTTIFNTACSFLTNTNLQHYSGEVHLSSFSQLFGFGFPGYGASLTLNLPVKNRAAQAELGSALVSRHRDLYSAQLVREQITLEVTNAVHQLEEAKLTLAAGKTAVDLAQKALTAEQRKYELGAQTIFFVLDSQTKLAQAELDLLQAEVNYQIARAAVDHATGGLLEPFQVQIAELTR